MRGTSGRTLPDLVWGTEMEKSDIDRQKVWHTVHFAEKADPYNP